MCVELAAAVITGGANPKTLAFGIKFTLSAVVVASGATATLASMPLVPIAVFIPVALFSQ
jgi:hypothetical protein